VCGDVVRILIPGMRPDDVVDCISNPYHIISHRIISYHTISDNATKRMNAL